MYTAPLPAARAKIVPIIVVPGITASVLTDWYPASPREIWSPTRLAFGDYEPMTLHPVPPTPAGEAAGDDRVRYEAVQPMLVRPSRGFGIIYDDLVAALRHDLSSDDVPIAPVYVFAYDWRQDNFVTIRQLAAFIDEVIERTRMMPHDPMYVEGETCDAVDLVGHSMGGNLIAACIAAGLVGTEERCKVRRVVTIGTPFRGAPAAVAKLATGLGSLTGRAARERERTAARMTPSVYQLLPTYPGGIVRRVRTAAKRSASHADVGAMEGSLLTDAGNTAWSEGHEAGSAERGAHDELVWEDVPMHAALASQPSVLESLAVFLRLHASGTGSLSDTIEAARRARSLLDDFLARAERFSELIGRVHPGMLRGGVSHSGWLVIAGAGEATHVRCEITRGSERGNEGGGGYELDFTSGFTTDEWDGESWDTGDDTVPMRSAAPPWEDGWRDMVVVRRGDFDWLGELGDRVLRDQLGLHATLPRLNLAQRWIVNFLRPEWMAGRTPGYRQHGTLWARPGPGFWTSGANEEIRHQIRRSPADREEIVQRAMERLWSAKLPGIRLSPAKGA